MKEIHKNPNLYYVIIPVLIAMWPVLLKTVYVPRVAKQVEEGNKDYESAQPVIAEILELDPDRLKLIDTANVRAEFDYAVVIDKVADKCKIRSSDYKLNARPAVRQSGRKIQQATIGLEKIDIETFSKFLSTLLQNWPDLECEDLKLTHKLGLKDSWDIQIRFKYSASLR